MSEKEVRCGGVVIRNDGRVLLREPTGHPEGTAWRFPTGKLSEKEPPEATVERVVQRIGTTARVVARIPGTFEGTSSLTTYFRMDFLGENGCIDPKTARVCWATLMEAQDMINAASSLSRRRRDLAVLEAVLRMPRIDEMIVPAKCSKTRKQFLAVFRRERDGWALSKSVIPGEVVRPLQRRCGISELQPVMPAARSATVEVFSSATDVKRSIAWDLHVLWENKFSSIVLRAAHPQAWHPQDPVPGWC